MLTLFRLIGWRNLLIFILAVALFLLVRQVFFSKDQQEMRVNALFDEVEFVQELRLVTYFSEELLEIGRQDEIGYRLEELRIEERNLKRDSLTQAATLRGSLQRDSLTRLRLAQLEGQMRSCETQKKSLSESIKDYPRLWKGIQKRLESNQRCFGDQCGIWYAHWKQEKRGRKADRMKDSISLLVRGLRAKETQRMDKLEVQMHNLHEKRRIARQSLKTIEGNLEESTILLEKTLTELLEVSTTLAAMQAGAEETETKGTPKLMAVVSTSVSAFTDLSRLKYDVVNDTLLRITCLPAAEIDPRVQMELAGEKGRFSLAFRRFRDFFGKNATSEGEGRYLDVYLEMKDAMERTRKQVVFDAMERGILEEADQLAQAYLKETALALGFSEVEFEAVCESVSDENLDGAVVSDSRLSPLDP
ncbi:MAG: DUF4230 domain-containing protein [Bacteroidota bacterium]